MLCKFLMLLLEIGVTYDVIHSINVKNIFIMVNFKFFLQLRCFNVLLHLEYKILLCEPKIGFTKLRGEIAEQPTIVLCGLSQLSLTVQVLCNGLNVDILS